MVFRKTPSLCAAIKRRAFQRPFDGPTPSVQILTHLAKNGPATRKELMAEFSVGPANEQLPSRGALTEKLQKLKKNKRVYTKKVNMEGVKKGKQLYSYFVNEERFTLALSDEALAQQKAQEEAAQQEKQE